MGVKKYYLTGKHLSEVLKYYLKSNTTTVSEVALD